MTRTEFNANYAANSDNWYEPETLNRLNDLAFEYLAAVDCDAEHLVDLVKSAFDHANNAL